MDRYSECFSAADEIFMTFSGIRCIHEMIWLRSDVARCILIEFAWLNSQINICFINFLSDSDYICTDLHKESKYSGESHSHSIEVSFDIKYNIIVLNPLSFVFKNHKKWENYTKCRYRQKKIVIVLFYLIQCDKNTKYGLHYPFNQFSSSFFYILFPSHVDLLFAHFFSHEKRDSCAFPSKFDTEFYLRTKREKKWIKDAQFDFLRCEK